MLGYSNGNDEIDKYWETSLYLSVTPKFYNITPNLKSNYAELWCKTLSWIKSIWFYSELKALEVYLRLPI